MTSVRKRRGDELSNDGRVFWRDVVSKLKESQLFEKASQVGSESALAFG
jgi:hypothetical protein